MGAGNVEAEKSEVDVQFPALSVLDEEHWHETLSQFAQSSGVCVSLFKTTGERVSGPHVANPLTAALKLQGVFAKNAPGTLVESNLVQVVRNSRAPALARVRESLPIYGLPVIVQGRVDGVFTLGWVFDHFADPVESDGLAKFLGMPEYELWQHVRQHIPVTTEKLRQYGELLQTITRALIEELVNRKRERRRTRVLHVINESARELGAASSYSDIAKATIEAARLLAHTELVRMVFADDRGSVEHLEASLIYGSPAGAVPLSRTDNERKLRLDVFGPDSNPLAYVEAWVGSAYGSRDTFDELRSELAAVTGQAAVAIQKVDLIADLKKKSETLQLAFNELEKAALIRDEFLATVSHELRNPLNAILGWTQLLRSSLVDPADQKSALETIERNAIAQKQLVDDLLDVSRIISGKMQLEVAPVDLAFTVREALKTLMPAIRQKAIKVTVNEIRRPVLIYGDGIRLQQVFWNVISNAVKYTPQGGALRIDWSVEGDAAIVRFSDSGQGISADFLPRLFERFTQADSATTRKEGGLGLGLAIVKQLVELHGGTITAESPGRGHGSTFTVKIPLASIERPLPAQNEPIPAAAAEIPKVARVIRNRKLADANVLVVDDSPDSRALMATLLKSQGAEVRMAESPRAALGILEEWLPDVIVSDIAMPGEDGYMFVSALRSLADYDRSRIPALAVTAYAREEDRLKALQSGFQNHVSKPIEPAKFVEAVRALFARAAAIDVQPEMHPG